VTVTNPWFRDRIKLLRLLTLVAVIAIAAVAVIVGGRIEPAYIGYPAVALMSFLGSATIFVPLPGFASVCISSGELSLNPLLLALVAGTCETAGELVGYSAGASGRRFIKHGKLYLRIQSWISGRKAIGVLFLFAAIPNPFFDIAGVAAGVLRMPLIKFLCGVFIGKVVKGLLIAYICILGFSAIPFLM
jgi:membrane protein YqaA with SNARE-associated domain